MTTSATLFGATTDGSERSYLDWQLVSQNPSTNKSTINWQAGWQFHDYSCRGLRNGIAVINGVTVYNDSSAPGDNVHVFSSSHDHNNGTGKFQTAVGTIVIQHNSDGTKSFSASMTMTGFSGHTSAGSTSWALPTIPLEPGAPSSPVATSIDQVSIDLAWTQNPQDGFPVGFYTVSYGTTEDADDLLISSPTLSKTIPDLTPNTRYYFKVKGTNAVGTGPYSPVNTFATVAGAYVSLDGIFKKAIPYVKVSGVWTLARPFAKAMGVWKKTVN